MRNISKNQDRIETEIKNRINTYDLIRAQNEFDDDSIKYLGKEEVNIHDTIVYDYSFKVASSSYINKFYKVLIRVDSKKKLIDVACSCPQYHTFHSCKHCGACLVFDRDIIFEDNKVLDPLTISNDFLEEYLKENKTIIKKELLLELKLEKIDEYYRYDNAYILKVNIGENKLYSLNRHLSSFEDAYENADGKVYFGKEFTYNPKNYYFNDQNQEIIEFILSLYSNSHNDQLFMDEREFRTFIKTIKNHAFIFNNYKINTILEKFPLKTILKKNENYEIEFENGDYEELTSNLEYIFYRGNIYHLEAKEFNLLKALSENDINKLVIDNDKFNIFSKSILPTLKSNLEIDETAKDVVISYAPSCELYFDLLTNAIIGKPTFIYDNERITYGEEKETKVIRDIDYENGVLNDLTAYNFVINNKKILIEDVNDMVYFMETGLEELASKYPVFTSEKLKKLEIKKKTNISSTFGLGQDNILSYNFSLGDIKSDELVNIFKEMQKKQKYYRLKSGDILDLEDDSLKQLENLSEDLELSDEDIINGHGSILKYRAIYLDSIKKDKYSIISTDNLFTNFIKQFEEYKNVDLNLTTEDKKVLRDYQLTGVKWLYNLAKTGFGGILADEMGLGKTIQVIYYIREILKENKDAKFLIVVPTSLAYNWEHEFSMFANNIKRELVVGNKANREKIVSNLNNTSVLITTYGLLREDKEMYNGIIFDTMIIDEAQNIKNNHAGITRSVKEINAKTKFALTGTPLENSVLELWSIFDFIMPGYLASLPKFEARYKIHDFDEETEKLIQGLSKQISPFILRRKKIDVIKELPEKIENNIYLDLGDEQKKLYAAELEKVKKEMEEVINTDGISKARFLILQLLTKLRQICIDPSIIYENYEGGSNKIDALIDTVNEYVQNGHKILIFSSFRTALAIVEKRLKKAKIEYHLIDGSVSSKERAKRVDEFNDNKNIKVFLIMLKSGGTGLNLTGADVVIHLDLWWNPQAENQATDRAHRIGQKNKVEVIRLITKGTIEEKILELQMKKRILSDKLIDGEIRDQNMLNQLTEQDIKNLLSYENE